MEITSTDVKLMQASWIVLAPNSMALATKFYNDLFDENPGLIHMFKGDMDKQAEKLMYTLGFLITNLERLDEIVKSVEELGRMHAKSYKVQPEHYPIVKNKLIDTIQHFMKEEWTEDHQSAWYKVISLVERTMIRGAANSSTFNWKFWK